METKHDRRCGNKMETKHDGSYRNEMGMKHDGNYGSKMAMMGMKCDGNLDLGDHGSILMISPYNFLRSPMVGIFYPKARIPHSPGHSRWNWNPRSSS
jgi:hypothetical protein